MPSAPDRDQLAGDLWARLARLRAHEVCMADWKRYLGSGSAPAHQYLIPLLGTVAATFPDPHSGLPMVPRLEPDGKYYSAFPDDPMSAIAPLHNIKKVTLTKHRLDWNALGKAIAESLGIVYVAASGPYDVEWVKSIGFHNSDQGSIPLLFIAAKTKREAHEMIQPLLAGLARWFVIPFHDEVCEQIATAKGHRFTALDRDTVFRKIKGRWILHARKRSLPSRRPNNPPWSKAELQKVIIDGTTLKFADGVSISLKKRLKCRQFLQFILTQCADTSCYDFDYQTSVENFNKLQSSKPISSDRLIHDLFKNVEHVERLFRTLDDGNQRFRLLIRLR